MKLKNITIAVLAIASLAGCRKNDSSSIKKASLITITDAMKRSVTIDTEKVNRVICIGAGALRLYSYIGDMNKIVAAEDIDRGIRGANPFQGISRPYYDVNKDLLNKLPSAGKGGPKNQAAESETLLAAKPEIIISEYVGAKEADTLQEFLGVPVVTVSYGRMSVFDDNVKASFTNLGKIFNKEQRAESLIRYINEAASELKSKAEGVKDEDKPALYVGGLGNWGKADIYSTSTSFPLFDISKVRYAIQGVKIDQGNIDHEKLIASNPDKIILDTAGMDNMRKTYKKDPTAFQSLKAFQQNEVYLEMPFNAYYTNLEIALMDAYYIASVAYPEKYQGFDIAKKSNEISKAFLNVECYDAIKQMPKSEGGFRKIENVQEFLSK